MRFKIVHKQLFIELTERSGSKQQSKSTLIKSLMQGERYFTLPLTLQRLSIILQQWRIKVSLILALLTISWRIWMKFAWFRMTFPASSLIKLNDLIVESCTIGCGSFRRETNYKSDKLTNCWAVYSGNPIKSSENARMLPCLYFQFSCLIVLEVNDNILAW